MIRDDIAIEPLGEWPAVPSADIEIDFDIEWDRDGRIYQWGLRVRDGQDESTARYDPGVSFDPLDEAAEFELAERFADTLEAHLLAAEADGRTVAIYHWTTPEVTRTRRFPRVAALLEGRTVDLCAWMNKEFRVRESFSLKDVAKNCGFSWGVEDAGGFMSLEKIARARGNGPDAAGARQWCLDYNEADVAAQAAIRDHLSRPRGVWARETGIVQSHIVLMPGLSLEAVRVG